MDNEKGYKALTSTPHIHVLRWKRRGETLAAITKLKKVIKMKFIKLILILIFISCSTITYSKNIKANMKKIKANEFSIGGSFKPVFGIGSSYGPFVLGFKIGLPICYTYYPNNIYGVGFIYTSGFELNLQYGYIPILFNFYNELSLVQKIGNSYKRYFLLEFGAILTGRFPRSLTDNNYFAAGPNILLGFENKFNNKFVFTIGIGGEILFGLADVYTEDDWLFQGYEGGWKQLMMTLGGINLEMRWKFYYFKDGL